MQERSKQEQCRQRSAQTTSELTYHHANRPPPDTDYEEESSDRRNEKHESRKHHIVIGTLFDLIQCKPVIGDSIGRSRADSKRHKWVKSHREVLMLKQR